MSINMQTIKTLDEVYLAALDGQSFLTKYLQGLSEVDDKILPVNFLSIARDREALRYDYYFKLDDDTVDSIKVILITGYVLGYASHVHPQATGQILSMTMAVPLKCERDLYVLQQNVHGLIMFNQQTQKVRIVAKNAIGLPIPE